MEFFFFFFEFLFFRIFIRNRIVPPSLFLSVTGEDTNVRFDDLWKFERWNIARDYYWDWFIISPFNFTIRRYICGFKIVSVYIYLRSSKREIFVDDETKPLIRFTTDFKSDLSYLKKKKEKKGRRISLLSFFSSFVRINANGRDLTEAKQAAIMSTLKPINNPGTSFCSS